MPEDSATAAPALVRSIGPTEQDEQLTTIESRYLTLAKQDSDRIFNVALVEIIKGHGHDPEDGRKYGFVDDERGKLILRIGSA